MKEQNEGHQNHHHQGKILNFNAPLLSTRRPANLAAIDLSSCPSIRHRSSVDVADDHHRIPFSWEKAPGKPKETKNDKYDSENDTPRPKLPPSLWRYRDMISAITAKNDENFNFDTNSNNDDEDDDNDNMNNSDDVYSLSEAIDIVERSQEKSDGLRLKIMEDRSRNDNQYPDFIIQRFLPDATALATASAISAMSLKKSSSDNHHHYREFHIPLAKRKISLSFSPPKGCGLMTLFPWRVKKRLCGGKSPVRRGISGGFMSCTSSMDQVFQRRHKDNRR